jgi:hypothetical protein
MTDDDSPGVERRFADADARARADWAAADAAACAARAGCELTPAGVLVPLLGASHLVTHPEGDVTASGRPAHVAAAILLRHYLLTAGGAPPAGRWAAYRELPGGLFYAASFAARAEAPLTRAFASPPPGSAAPGSAADALASVPETPAAPDSATPVPAAVAGLEAFRLAAASLGGEALDLADAAFSFRALPRVPVAVLIWLGDEEMPGEAHVLFDAGAHGYLPSEDLAGLGGLLAGRLVAAASGPRP